jgi:Transcription factor WhiB
VSTALALYCRDSKYSVGAVSGWMVNTNGPGGADTPPGPSIETLGVTMQVNGRSLTHAVDPPTGLLPVSCQRWRDQGACAAADPEMFFPEPFEPAEDALAMCATCPVSGECLSHALSTPELYGVWGGTTEEERESLLRWMHREATRRPGGQNDLAEAMPGTGVAA